MSLSVFISYSVEDGTHNTRVMKFANDLRMKGINVFIFDDLPYGEKFCHFMERIPDLDFTLIICTPEYKRKADERISGVGRETEIMTDTINRPFDHRQFIPILFSGDWDRSIPKWARNKKGIDYRDSSQLEFNKMIKFLRRFEGYKDCEEIDANEVVPQKEQYSWDREKRMMRLTENDGSESVAEVLLSFKFNDTGREFIIYSPVIEADQTYSNMVNVASVIRKPDDNVLLGDIIEEDWEKIKKLL